MKMHVLKETCSKNVHSRCILHKEKKEMLQISVKRMNKQIAILSHSGYDSAIKGSGKKKAQILVTVHKLDIHLYSHGAS